MPRRWLSLRGHQREPKDDVNVVDGHFDFEFSCPSAFASPTSPVCNTPAMFATQNRPKRVKRSPTRPRTSDGSRPAVDRRLQLTKVDDSWIGVAFGSPTHPPAFCPTFADNEMTIPSNQAFRLDGPLPTAPQPASRVKKFGNMFKLRSTSAGLPISAPMNVCKLDGDSQTKISPLLMRDLPDVPKYDPKDLSTVIERQTHVIRKPLPMTKPEHIHPRLRSELPRLEIQIPSVELDRYSVMFKNVSGIKPSSLLERRSRNLTNLKLTNSADSDIPPVPVVKPLSAPTPTTPRARVSYSLFPAQSQAAAKTHGNFEKKGAHSRAASRADARMSEPVKATSVDREPEIEVVEQRTPTLQKGSDSSFTSPDDTVTSSETDDTPWRSVDSLPSVPSSRTSAGSEFFFDLKPFRDSNGEEQADYIIHKPDTPEVERAMSRSHKAKKSQLSLQTNFEPDFGLGPDLQAAEYVLKNEDQWRLSAQLNQAIADVQRLTSPSHSVSPPIELTSPEMFQTKPNVQELMPAIRLRKRLEGLAIGIPSPITERSEVSPRTPLAQQPLRTTQPSPTNVPAKQRNHVAAMSIKPAPLNTDCDRLSEAFFEVPPPPVPKKDKKFLPVSKYAVANSSAKPAATEPQKIRRKPHRAVTDSSIMMTTSPKDARPRITPGERTSSLPINTLATKSPQAQLDHPYGSPTPSSATLSPRTNLSNTISNSIAKAMLVPSVTVQPTAEVSVAREVSVTRKQSHQILLSKASTGKADEQTNSGSTENAVDGTTRRLNPEVKEVAANHRPGHSMNLIVECMK